MTTTRIPGRGLLLLALTTLTTGVLGGCKSGQLPNQISPAQERQMGADAAAQVDRQAKIVSDGKINRRLLDISTPVFAQANKDKPDVNFRIRMIDDPEINAFSIPGGYIYLYRGLYDKLGSDDDALACVIAHEATHISKRHMVKQISDAQGKGLAVSVLAVLTGSNTVGQVADTVAALDSLHFSREDEYEADRYGEKYAYNAGYDPAGMVRTFQVLEKVEARYGGQPAYALDHPINRNRSLRALEQLRELRANHGNYMTDKYSDTGDKLAAEKNGIDYATLVLSTNLPTPLGHEPATEKPVDTSIPMPAIPARVNPANGGSDVPLLTGGTS